MASTQFESLVTYDTPTLVSTSIGGKKVAKGKNLQQQLEKTKVD